MTVATEYEVLAVLLVGSVVAAPQPRTWLMGVCLMFVGLLLARLA